MVRASHFVFALLLALPASAFAFGPYSADSGPPASIIDRAENPSDENTATFDDASDAVAQEVGPAAPMVPEPSALALVIGGWFALFGRRSRRFTRYTRHYL